MSKTQGIEQTGGVAGREQEAGSDHLLNVGQVFPALKDSLDTATQALSVAPLELQEFGNGMLSHIAKGGKDIEEAAEAYMRQKNFKGRERSLAVKLLSLLLIPSLALAACAGGAIAATPEKPIQPTVQMTETIEEPTQAPTQAPTTAPTEIPTEIPTAEPTPDSPYGHWTAAEAVTKKLSASEERRVQQELSQLISRFPLIYNEAQGVYGMQCVLESISYLKEGHYITFGDYNIRVTGQCSYLDINGDKQTVTVALWIENTKNNTTWLPHNGILGPYRTSVSRTQEVFERYTSIEPGNVVGVEFGLNSKQPTIPGGKHNPELIRIAYDQTQIDSFVSSGNPEELDHLIVPTDLYLMSN